jgi:CheY-like chemotaxis protein/anti-sigma regulatory factor (Ser/Thr protein kinase)
MQVVRNLCDNAAKFTSSGQIVCRVTHEDAGQRGTVLRISVDDTGPGIPDAIKASIFEAFVQADNSVTRQYGGSGLGLTICAQIASMMHGGIELRSEVGHGACFTFTARFTQASTPPALDDATRRAWQGKVIGLAIPNEAARSALRRQLEAWGLRCEDCPPADEHACDACLFDAVLAERDPGAVEKLRLQGMARQGRVAWLLAPTGPSDASSVRQMPQLRKPVKTGELARVLNGLFAPEVSPETAIAQTEQQDKKDDHALAILLAEDHPVNQRLALRLLEKRGHHVTVANNGAIALEQVRTGHFDLILMDLQMPVMDGLSATKAIRELEAGTGRHTPIIALTAHAMKGDLEDMLSQGVDDYLAKPFDAKELARLVAAIASRMSPGGLQSE